MIAANAHHSPTSKRPMGADYFDHRYTERVRRRAIRVLEQQGYRVTLDPAG